MVVIIDDDGSEERTITNDHQFEEELMHEGKCVGKLKIHGFALYHADADTVHRVQGCIFC